MEQHLSSPPPERLRAWRLYFESALALVDVLDAELERDAGIPLRWYDALVHLEETPDGLRMNELAERIPAACRTSNRRRRAQDELRAHLAAAPPGAGARRRSRGSARLRQPERLPRLLRPAPRPSLCRLLPSSLSRPTSGSSGSVSK